MANTELLVRLRDLHEELAGINNDLNIAEHVDEETIDALGQLVTDVGEIVDKTKEAVVIEGEDLTDRHGMLDRVMQFDAEHPRVVRFLSEMTDLLAMMGI